MKLKALALVAAVLMTASCFAACSNNASSDTSDTSSETNTSNDSSSDAEVSLEHNQIEITSTPVTDLEGVEAPYMYNNISTRGLEFDYINRNSGGIGIPYDVTDNKVVSLLSTEEAVSKVITNKYWLDNGLRNADSLTAESSWIPVYYGQGWVNCEAFWENNDHGSVVISTCVPAVYTTDSIVGSGNAISINSDHIERSLLFLQWINCNSEARDIFCYGVEGVHWNKTAEGTAERTEAGNTGYRPGNFAQGTFFTETPEAPKSLDSWDGLLESCMNAIATPLLGFTPDNSAIENELAATNMIWSQYSRAFMVGATENPEAELLLH